MKVDILEKKLGIPQGIEVQIDGRIVTVKGQKGAVNREIKNPKLDLKKIEKEVILSAKKATKREKKEIFTYASHIKNMFKGAKEGHEYQLKICSGHFPMNVSVSDNELIIKNFIGEKYPRKIKIKDDVSVKIEGDKIIVEHVSKELAGQTAADIELLTRRPGFDTRIFQDGIYIIKKDGKDIA
ncbi:50S ribosomal protein L6 [Candidatus Woesearchaeota archaeon]|nr:50S ribosomal protein L6 [Candidatus Woesearchaeota archaeon]